jgi:hypothetical protein
LWNEKQKEKVLLDGGRKQRVKGSQDAKKKQIKSLEALFVKQIDVKGTQRFAADQEVIDGAANMSLNQEQLNFLRSEFFKRKWLPYVIAIMLSN